MKQALHVQYQALACLPAMFRGATASPGSNVRRAAARTIQRVFRSKTGKLYAAWPGLDEIKQLFLVRTLLFT